MSAENRFGSGLLQSLASWVRSLSSRMTDSSLRRRVGRLHIKIDHLALGLDKLRAKLEESNRFGLEVDKGTQILLAMKYRELAAKRVVLPLPEVEFRNFSQSGEDGILHYIFSLIGTIDRRAVEICAGAGFECNSANLIISHGWHALLFDGNEDNVRKGQKFFAEHPDTRISGPVFVHSWIQRDSINDQLREHGFSGELDLLSVDLDGVDYWIWEAITEISPRVVVVEVNPAMSGSAVTVPYRDDFRAALLPLAQGGADQAVAALRGRSDFCSHSTVYAGASLPAFVKLARRKGYRLIGTNNIGINAFFLRDDVGADYFPEVSAQSCVKPNVSAFSATAASKLGEYPWQEV